MRLLNVIWLLFFICLSCQKQKDSLELALQSAGDNRKELEKVLVHYKNNPADSLKYKAAVFLIENMPYYYYYEGEQLDNYLNYYKILKENPDRTPEYLLDSITKLYGDFSLSMLNKKYDILEIDSAYLCNNIEWSFKVWREQPWGKHISFDEFCEGILPYRIGTEALTNWKEKFYTQYNSYLTKIKDEIDKDDPLVAAKILTDSIRDEGVRFTLKTPEGITNPGPFACQYASGNCQNLSDFVIYACRSVGIPCYMDFVPLKGNENTGHFWVTFYDKKKNLYIQDFLAEILPVRAWEFIQTVQSLKTYRKTFSLNKEVVNHIGKNQYPFFAIPKHIDMTNFYSTCYAETFEIPDSCIYDKQNLVSKIVYLCLPSKMQWTPVAWTNYKKGRLQFNEINKGNLVRVATYENRQLVFHSDPFYINCTGALQVWKPFEEKESITLMSKVPVAELEIWFAGRLIDGVFEGSNQENFSQKDTIFRITKRPDRLLTAVDVDGNKKYRYVRYFGAAEANSCIAEVEFYENPDDSIPMKGRIMGTPGSWQGDGSHEYTNVFDGRTDTSFDYKEHSGGWAGLDLGKPRQISRIVYAPPNYDNYVRPGDLYELFYLDKDWISAGKQKASSDSLLYTDIPQNVLLFLKNHTRGVQERIFTYEGRKQVWW